MNDAERLSQLRRGLQEEIDAEPTNPIHRIMIGLGPPGLMSVAFLALAETVQDPWTNKGIICFSAAVVLLHLSRLFAVREGALHDMKMMIHTLSIVEAVLNIKPSTRASRRIRSRQTA